MKPASRKIVFNMILSGTRPVNYRRSQELMEKLFVYSDEELKLQEVFDDITNPISHRTFCIRRCNILNDKYFLKYYLQIILIKYFQTLTSKNTFTFIIMVLNIISYKKP